MKKLFQQFSVIFIITYGFLQNASAQQSVNNSSLDFPLEERLIKDNSGLNSIETGLTISLVRTAKNKSDNYIVANSYEGTLLGISFQGKTLWRNKLSGFMNHDIWCADITGDGKDEILVANATGTLYCLNSKGETLWEFKKNDAPMKSVCVMHKDNIPYVVAGSYDTNIYYLDEKGNLIDEIKSNTYSLEKGNKKLNQKHGKHLSNFVRPVLKADGTEVLLVHGIKASHFDGAIYLFKPLEKLPYKKFKNKAGRIGEVRVCDTDGGGDQEVLVAKTGEANKGSGFSKLNIDDESFEGYNVSALRKRIDNFGYRVTQPELVTINKEQKYFIMFGSRAILAPMSMSTKDSEVLACKYAFNDMWKVPNENKIVLASVQSGGSAVHIINLENPKWEKAYQNLNPPGKIETILNNTTSIRKSLKSFKKPSWQNESAPVYFLSENRKNQDAREAIESIESKYNNPVFLQGVRPARENWDRATVKNEKYFKKRDKRQKYVLSQQEAVDFISDAYNQTDKGIAYWAGHGNDPYMYQLSTTKKVLDKAQGKKTVMIFPELEDHSEDFNYVMDDLIYPLANYAQDKNANIYVRTKHVFWYANVYLSTWNRLVSGEFSNVFVPAMEETTDKSMELSLAGRMGIWSSGAIDSWGARCARDNASFDRTRQHSHQMLPNHFLRTMVYSISSGAQYIDNFAVDQEYMSLLWNLIAEGVLYVPKRSEILSISPVHLSMTKPDKHFLEEGSRAKFVAEFDEDVEAKNKMVFSRLNGSWPGAVNTAWDFSRYAAGAEERRLNFIPKYNNGLVLLTPPQQGVHADKNAKRKPLAENLHPMYKNILKEYISDGRDYLSSDGKEKYAANEYYKVIDEDIKKSASLLPITVSGNVGWVVAQTSPTHLRLTLVENGYINPNEATAVVKFNTINPVKINDLLNKEEFKLSKDSTIEIKIPLGGFRFIDIELKEKL